VGHGAELPDLFGDGDDAAEAGLADLGVWGLGVAGLRGWGVGGLGFGRWWRGGA